MHQDAKASTLKLHNAQTKIMALKKGDITWEMPMMHKGAELETARKAEESYRKERLRGVETETEAMRIVSSNKAKVDQGGGCWWVCTRE